MKIARLYQPRNPLFWMWIVLNVLSLGLGWITHHVALTTLGSALIGGFALGNAALGVWLAWRLANS
jgi:hypothetical protein